MTYRRGWIAASLFLLAMINYMDRIALSIAAKPIAQEFKLSAVGMGYLFSSFIWSYALFLLPMGVLIDRFGAKRLAGAGMFVWSAATMLTGAMTNFGGLLAARLVMGAGESSSNPVGAKVIRQWFPAAERGLVTAIFNSGSYAGPAICSLFLGALLAVVGWRWSFVVAGAIGFIWLAAWLSWFQPPERANWLSKDERSKVLAERQAAAAPFGAEGAALSDLMKSLTLWGLALTQGCNVYTQYLFLTWLPSYLQTTRHLSVAATGVLSAVPYAVSVVLCIATGWCSDLYLKRTGVAGGRRRNVIAFALLLAAAVLAVPFVSELWLLVLVFSITLTGIASTTSLNFSLLNDLMPDGQNVAKAMAFVVVGGNLFGMAAPIVTGYVVADSGSYDWAFAIAGLLLLCGAAITLTMTRRPILTAQATARSIEAASGALHAPAR